MAKVAHYYNSLNFLGFVFTPRKIQDGEGAQIEIQDKIKMDLRAQLNHVFLRDWNSAYASHDF